MSTLLPLERTLTELDHVRLGKLLQRLDGQHAAARRLEAVLDEADCVDARAVRPDVVTMHSRVLLASPSADATPAPITLCYPEEADAAQGRISVLSPVGVALLGVRVGAQLDVPRPDGRHGAGRVVEILYQPEASGDYTA